MHKRGELEIAINKRTLERSMFILVIVILSILVLYQHFTKAEDKAVELAQLEQTVAEQNTQITQLQKQLETQTLQRQETPAPPPVIAEPTAPESQLSGKLQFNWSVDGAVLTPSEYNADAVAELETALDDLETTYEDASSTRRKQLQDEMDALRKELRTLKEGDSKFKLYNVTVSIDNGQTDFVAIDYTLCWPQIDCINVKSEGIINAPSGELTTKVIPLKIPTFISIDKTKQTLRLTLKQDNKEVFKQDYTVTA